MSMFVNRSAQMHKDKFHNISNDLTPIKRELKAIFVELRVGQLSDHLNGRSHRTNTNGIYDTSV
jgi:hypothetical protein